MAADAWKVYNSAKEYMGDGTLDLDTDTLKVGLLTSSYTPALTNTTWAGISANEISNAGYTAGGYTITQTWAAAGGDATQIVLDSDDPNWTASGASIVARYAVLYSSTGGELIAYSLLDNSPADVTTTAGNTLTIQLPATGYFYVDGAD